MYLGMFFVFVRGEEIKMRLYVAVCLDLYCFRRYPKCEGKNQRLIFFQRGQLKAKLKKVFRMFFIFRSDYYTIGYTESKYKTLHEVRRE